MLIYPSLALEAFLFFTIYFMRFAENEEKNLGFMLLLI